MIGVVSPWWGRELRLSASSGRSLNPGLCDLRATRGAIEQGWPSMSLRADRPGRGSEVSHRNVPTMGADILWS